MKFTDRYIANLKPQSARYQVREANAHGSGSLAVRISPNGRKVWQYIYRFDGKVRRLTLGRYPAMSVAEARVAFGEAVLQREMGVDPGQQTVDMRRAAREAPTVRELSDQYLELYARPNKRSADRDEELLERNVLPFWGPRKAASIKRGDVARLLDSIVARGAPVPANRTRSVLSKMFRWGLSRDLVEINPVAGVPAPTQERRCARVLSEEELGKVLRKLGSAAMADATRLALRLQLLTGARVGEAAGAQWEEIDLDAGLWTIPAERSKNKRTHRLPLSSQALSVLGAARALDRGTDAVFPAIRTDNAIQACSVASAVRANLKHFDVTRFTPHDVRRTVATALSEAGVSRVVVSKVLNHIDASVTAIYDRYEYMKEMRAALDAWGRKVEAIEVGRKLSLVG